MKNKFTRSLTIFTLSTGLLFSSFVQSPSTQVAAANTTSQIEHVLSKLTPKQRQALNQLHLSDESGLQLSQTINLESDEDISVIVEFKDKPAKSAVVEAAAQGKKLSINEAKRKVEEAHQTFQSDLQEIYQEDVKKKKNTHKIKRLYKNAMNGVSMELPANKVEELLQSDVVKAVWSNDEVHVMPPVPQEKATNEGKETGILTFPGVDQLHAEGITGKGVKVGVIDTGIDYLHPDLKDVYKGGYDFVDNDNDPMETTYEDWKNSGSSERNPLTGSFYYTQHGTHVSGIVAGTGNNNNDYAVTGVAPDAELYAYRVLGPYGSGYTENIIAAIDKAVVDGMDVINLSLGANYNNPMYATSIAVNNAVLAGVTAVVSAGNSGNGMYTLGSPGTAELAITVGASDTSEKIVTAKGTLHADHTISTDLKLLAKGYEDNLAELEGENLPVVDVGPGYESSYTNKDVNGKIVLVQRGLIEFPDKITNAYKNGAKAVLLYNNVPEEGFIPVYLGKGYQFVPTFSLSYEQGIKLRENVLEKEVAFSFDEMGQETTEGNKLANFSSRGPARTTYDIKPEVIAPGVSVFSTVPSYMNGEDQIGKYEYAYERLSGTSMASPNTAGVAALLLQVNPDLSPSQIKQILMNTADPLSGEYSVYEVGAGVVDPYEAVHSDVRIEVQDTLKNPVGGNENRKSIENKTAAFSFGTYAPSGQHLTDNRSVVLFNNSKESKTFDVEVKFQKDRRNSKDAQANGVKLSTVTEVKVNGNAQKKMNVFITIPKSAELGTYEGYVVYTNRNNQEETYQVPFAFQTVDEGINSLRITPEAFTHSFDYAYAGMLTAGHAIFNLKSHMKTLDLFLVDGNTNKEIGFIGTIDGFSSSATNIELGINRAFEGTFYPLTGSPDNPIAYQKELANPGYYKVKLVGTNDKGKTFSKEAPVYFEHTAPTISLDIKSDVYEYKPDEKTVNISGSVFDKEIESMKEVGLSFTQGDNNVFYRDLLGRQTGQLPVNEDGSFSLDIPMNETSPMHLWFYARDVASNQTFRESREIFFIREGEPYAFGQPESAATYMGDTMDVTLSLNNVEDVKEAVYTFDYKSNLVEIVDVKPHQSLKDKVTVKTEDLHDPYLLKKQVTITVKDGEKPLSGDLSLVDVTYKVKDEYSAGPISPQQLKTSYTVSDGNTHDMLFSVSSSFYMIPTYSLARASIKAESMMIYYGTSNEQPLGLIDYSTIGAVAQVTGEDGKVYEGIFNQNPQVHFKLPLTDETFEMELNIPGHFNLYRTFNIGFHEDGKTINQNKLLLANALAAGDVNNDNVIDVMDAVYIQEKWGTSDRNADINFDGKVDALDIGFVKKNYFMQNPTVEKAPEAKKNFKGKTLEKILQELGI
ncbi:S8 family serine peptidase [Sutcliffiella halmapala]|uniref:S8 family serine peptidase n=1 Tax=Sutcliffiella halmapala TaxID=79882 RepID=UPI0009953CD0|nr:S8 family serine peptidase [Sutcliffiella halmapala]